MPISTTNLETSHITDAALAIETQADNVGSLSRKEKIAFANGLRACAQAINDDAATDPADLFQEALRQLPNARKRTEIHREINIAAGAPI